MIPAKNGQKDFPKSLVKPGALFLLTGVNNLLAGWNIKSYLVGGFVRDTLLGRETADIDIAVDADALEIASRIATALGGRYIPLDEVNRVGRVILVNNGEHLQQWELDFTTIDGNIEQDLARRDFTIDAMAVDLSQLVDNHTTSLIDPFDGASDLRQGILRIASETAFESDAVRLLRAVRLTAELGFTIEKQTEALIQRHAQLISQVAGERTREELLRLLTIPRSEQLLPYLDKLELLTAIIPELAQAKGVEQPPEHFWDVFNHSLKTVAAVDFLLRQDEWKYVTEEILSTVPWSSELAQHFNREVSSGSSRRTILKLAALLHDIAKPQAKAIVEGGRIRFLGHGKEGAVMISGILERLRFSAKEIKLVETLVREHLRPGQMSQNELPSHRAIYRYFRDTGEAGIDILFLSLADHLAARGPNLKLPQWKEHVQIVEYVLTQRQQQEHLIIPPKLIDGHDLINIFGISPGPKIGELLEAVREAQASGEINTREEALSYINRWLALPNPTTDGQ